MDGVTSQSVMPVREYLGRHSKRMMLEIESTTSSLTSAHQSATVQQMRCLSVCPSVRRSVRPSSAGLTTRLTRLQPRAPDFLGPPKRPRPRKGLNEFSLMCEIREIMKIVLVQFHLIYLISSFEIEYIGMSGTISKCSCCRLPLSISYAVIR